MANTIERQDNRVIVHGELYDFHRLIAILHTIVEKLRFSDQIQPPSRSKSSHCLGPNPATVSEQIQPPAWG